MKVDTTRKVVRKAIRLAVSGRVKIDTNTDDVLAGRVRGDSGTYRVVIDPSGHVCECPARVQCSHVVALLIEANADAQALLRNAQ